MAAGCFFTLNRLNNPHAFLLLLPLPLPLLLFPGRSAPAASTGALIRKRGGEGRNSWAWEHGRAAIRSDQYARANSIPSVLLISPLVLAVYRAKLYYADRPVDGWRAAQPADAA